MFCNVCNRHFEQFESFCGRQNVSCPQCKSLERHRWLWWYISTQTSYLQKYQRILDNTQEFFLQDKFRTTNADYICAGYEKDFPHVNLRADLTDLPFRDSLFDLAIVCHILEHIPDDLRALSELYRVLNSEGSLIIIIPYKADLATLEQHTSSKNERKLLYGDENHYRVYGNDFENKLIKAGFGLKDIPKCSDYKLNGGERAFVCSKLLKISS